MIFRVYLGLDKYPNTCELGCTFGAYTHSPRTIAFVFSPSRFRFPLFLPFDCLALPFFLAPFPIAPLLFHFFLLSLAVNSAVPPSASIFLRPILSLLLTFLSFFAGPSFLFFFLSFLPLPTLPTFALWLCLFFSPSLQHYFYSSLPLSFYSSTLFLIISFSLCLHSPPLLHPPFSLSLSAALSLLSSWPSAILSIPPFSRSSRGLSLSSRDIISQRQRLARVRLCIFRVARRKQDQGENSKISPFALSRPWPSRSAAFSEFVHSSVTILPST